MRPLFFCEINRFRQKIHAPAIRTLPRQRIQITRRAATNIKNRTRLMCEKTGKNPTAHHRRLIVWLWIRQFVKLRISVKKISDAGVHNLFELRNHAREGVEAEFELFNLRAEADA